MRFWEEGGGTKRDRKGWRFWGNRGPMVAVERNGTELFPVCVLVAPQLRPGLETKAAGCKV